VIQALGIDRSDHILDLGCGHGRSLTELAARASTAHVVGADPSELMVEIAAQRDRALIKADRVEAVLASVESLPFPDESFDKVLCVHVLYFWKDLDASMLEVVRVSNRLPLTCSVSTAMTLRSQRRPASNASAIPLATAMRCQ
jgi:ubiquinone/menaquinone biosynthesis C-methylase UbiE